MQSSIYHLLLSIGMTNSDQLFKAALLFSPLLIGAIIALVNSDGINKSTENAEVWTRSTKAKIALKDGWLNQYVLKPIFSIIVRFCDWTDSLQHRGYRNGIRVAATLYLVAAWCFIIYAVFMIAVFIAIAVVLLYIVSKVLVNSNEDVKRGYEKGRNMFPSQKDDYEDINRHAAMRGQKIYSGTNWFNEELKGRVDEDGNIYKGTNWFNEEKIGRIDSDGNIYKGTNWFNEEKTGRVDGGGGIYKGTNWLNEEKIGRIDDDGNIHKGTNWFNEEKTGRAGE